MGGGSCTDSNTDEEQAILIPQEALSATIAADSGLKHTVSFETTGEWWASVEAPGSGDTWITLSPTFGSAGKNTITATLTENIQPTSRKAVITILCGTESAAITITQQGTCTSEEPAKPEHPEISPKNRLTYIEVSENKKTTTEDGTEESTTQGYIDLIYDAQGVLTNFNYYTFDRNQPDKLNGSSKTVLNWGANKFSLSQYNIEITSYSSIPRITKDDRSESYQLNKSGLISQYSYFDDNRDVFIYNPDGTLATKEFYLAGTALENLRSKYKWEAGDLTSITASASSYCFSYTYTYTQFLNPWNGIDIGSFAIAGVDDIGCLLGISGTTTKHLPASQQTKYKNSQYQYTFDNEGRVSTIVVTSTFHNPESMENISIATQTEYTLHYGTTPSPEPDYLAYLTDQKIIEEGTLGYIFDGDDPEGEHIVLPNAYTSYAKILNTLSDGTTKETTEYRQVKITLPEEHLGYIYVTQQDIDDFELISVTQEKEDDGKDITSPLTYTFTFEYNCFTEKIRLKIEPPYCNLYSEQTGTWNLHPMPTLPLDDDCIVCYPPEVTQLNDNPIQIDYKFVQKYVIKINPEAEITDQNVSQIDRLLYVRQ